MPFCSECGTQYETGVKFCSACGKQFSEGESAAGKKENGTAGSENTSQAQPGSNNFGQTFNNFNNTADSTGEFTREDIENNKVLALFAYLGILILVPVFAANNSRFAKFHVNQGLIFLITAFIAGGVMGVVNVIFTILGGLFLNGFFVLLSALITIPISIVLFVFMILGICNAVSGKAKELPIIGKFKIYKY